MKKILLSLFFALVWSCAVNAQQCGTGVPNSCGGMGVPNTASLAFNILPASMQTLQPDIYLNFSLNMAQMKGSVSQALPLLTVARASSKTNLLSTAAAGATFSTFGSNVAAQDNNGLLIEESRTNFLLNSTAPATQTTGSLATGTYTLWVNGSGGATMSAGTATGCGTSEALIFTPISFTITVAGTCTVTVSGSLNAFQLELNPGTVSAPTSLIVTAGATATRAADVITLTSPGSFGSSYSFFTQWIPNTPTNYGTTQELISFNDGTSNNRIGLRRFSGSANVGALDVSAGTIVFNSGFAGGNAVLNPNVVGKLATGFNASGSAGVFDNNGAIGSFTGALAVSPTVLDIGSGPGGVNFTNGYIQSMAIWYNQLLTSTQQASITQ